MPVFTVEDFIRQRLGDRETEDYFPGDGELTNIIWRHVVSRTSQLTLNLTSIEIRLTPLPTPGVNSSGAFWIYNITQYEGNLFFRVAESFTFEYVLHQPAHRYALFQTNAYLDDVFITSQPDIDEVVLSATFDPAVTGTVSLRGYVVNLNRIMHEIFMAIADDISKLAIFQSTVGGSTNLIQAARIAKEEAQSWLVGTLVYDPPMRGSRARRHGHHGHNF